MADMADKATKNLILKLLPQRTNLTHFLWQNLEQLEIFNTATKRVQTKI